MLPVVRVAVALSLMLLVPAAALAEALIALVITNQAYTQAGARLTNTHHDGDVVKAALETVGFKVWVVRDTANENALLQAIGGHVQRLADAGSDAVGFFYYSGHGAADRPNGENYLIPTDVPLTHVAQLPLVAVRLEKITATLASAGKMSFVVFDACRRVPLQRDDKDLTFKGFAPVREQRGLLVAFATEPGNVAVDQSLYATALAEEIVRPGLEAGQVFRAVTRRVLKDTQQLQSPEYLDKRLNDFHFAALASKPVPPVPPAPQVSEAERTWQWIKDTSNQTVLENFIKQFGDTPAGTMARARLADLTKVAIAAPPEPKPAPPKPPPPSAHCDGFEVAVGLNNERRCLRPGAGKTESFKDCPTCPEMVAMPTGRFTMGSSKDEPERAENEDQLSVTIAKPFAVSRFAGTRGEFAAFVAATGHKTGGGCYASIGTEWKQQADRNWRSPGFSQTDRHPVVCVTWNDAKAYAAWLSKTTGKTYRLLSETEREYVARAGTTTPFWWGKSISTSQANYDGSHTYAGGTKGEIRKSTVAVDSFAANSWGLHNVHGNVWEWTEDCWNEKNADNPGNGGARTSGDCGSRVLRGGSWNNFPQSLRSANRVRNERDNRSNHRGFRVARTLD